MENDLLCFVWSEQLTALHHFMGNHLGRDLSTLRFLLDCRWTDGRQGCTQCTMKRARRMPWQWLYIIADIIRVVPPQWQFPFGEWILAVAMFLSTVGGEHSLTKRSNYEIYWWSIHIESIHTNLLDISHSCYSTMRTPMAPIGRTQDHQESQSDWASPRWWAMKWCNGHFLLAVKSYNFSRCLPLYEQWTAD